MVRDTLFIKMLFVFLFVMLTSILIAQEYTLEQNDIKQFLAFAEEYRALANKFLKNTDDMTISDIFYTENSKMLSATNNFLKSNKWTYEKMNDFLYYVSCAMDAISFYDEYGYPEEVGEDESDPFKDIPKAVIDLVKANKEALLKYFPITDFSLNDEEVMDEEQKPDMEEEGDFNEDLPPEEDMPPDAG